MGRKEIGPRPEIAMTFRFGEFWSRWYNWGDWLRKETSETRKRRDIHAKEVNGVVVYENMQEIVDPKHSCLVVWDVQNGLVDRSFNKEEFLANLKNFIEKLRGRMPVVYTLITPVAKGL